MTSATSNQPTPDLPPPRTAGRYVVALVCLGNICRSPTAAVVLRDRLVAAGLDDRVEVISGGTGGWHVGEPMDRRAAATLTAAGYDPALVDAHAGCQVDAGWFADADLVLAMDAANLVALRDLGGAAPRLRLFRAFDPEATAGTDDDVPDPYYGGPDGFADVLAMVERTCDELVALLRAATEPPSR